MTYHWCSYWVNWNSFEGIMGLEVDDRRSGLKTTQWVKVRTLWAPPADNLHGRWYGGLKLPWMAYLFAFLWGVSIYLTKTSTRYQVAPLIIAPGLTYTLNQGSCQFSVPGPSQKFSTWTCHPSGKSSQSGLVTIEILSWKGLKAFHNRCMSPTVITTTKRPHFTECSNIMLLLKDRPHFTERNNIIKISWHFKWLVKLPFILPSMYLNSYSSITQF